MPDKSEIIDLSNFHKSFVKLVKAEHEFKKFMDITYTYNGYDAVYSYSDGRLFISLSKDGRTLIQHQIKENIPPGKSSYEISNPLDKITSITSMHFKKYIDNFINILDKIIKNDEVFKFAARIDVDISTPTPPCVEFYIVKPYIFFYMYEDASKNKVNISNRKLSLLEKDDQLYLVIYSDDYSESAEYKLNYEEGTMECCGSHFKVDKQIITKLIESI